MMHMNTMPKGLLCAALLSCSNGESASYDPDRTTYIYNLTKYDRVFILTDANPASEGTGDLRGALESAGNGNISVIRWQYDRNKETV